MKKILLIAAFFISTGVLSSCTKDNNITPSKISTKVSDAPAIDEGNPSGGKLGTGDGGVN